MISSAAVKARLFGSGSPATGEPAELAVVGEELEIRSASAAQRIAIATMRVREVGTGRPGLEFAWDSPDGACAVQVLDADAAAALQRHPALASTAQVSGLKVQQRRMSTGRAIG